MKYKTFILLGAGYCLFLVLLFFATDIVLALPAKDLYRVNNINPAQYEDRAMQFDARLESFSERKDLLYVVEFSGYAFIKTGQESSNKEIKLVFISEAGCYEVGTEVIEKFFLRDLFNERGIVGIKHGFTTRFSPLSMKNGVYKLYIFDYENEETSGITDTGLVFEKTYRSFSRIK